MNIANLTPQQLRKAADIQEKILTLQSELIQILGAPAAVQAPMEAPEEPKHRKGMSAAGRAAIAAAARARWAKLRAAKALATPSAKPAQKPKIQRSAAWKAAISAAAKARWAKAKRAGKSRW